jgi:hypothetical protein
VITITLRIRYKGCYIMKSMLLKPILSGHLSKWAYTLVEYELEYKPLKAMKGHVVADFLLIITLM